MTRVQAMIDRVKVYRDRAGEWRWRLQAGGNNAVLGGSGEGYESKQHAVAMAERVTGLKPDEDTEADVADGPTFYEEDEPVADVVAAFEAGEQGTTAAPVDEADVVEDRLHEDRALGPGAAGPLD